MASFQILLPKMFDFAQPEQWQKVASLIRKIQTNVRPHFKKQETQVNMLIYLMKEEADSILYLFGLSGNNRKSTTQYQTSPRFTLLSKATLSTNEEV